VVLRLGGEGHRALLERRQELGGAWETLSQQSKANFRQDEKSLAYLITPGAFERKHKGQTMCRAYPWEWKREELVSVATAKPVPISSRIRDEKDNSKNIPVPQVFAAPPGSVYYLELPPRRWGGYPLFQDDPPPIQKNGQERPHPIRVWRQLGYSELLWISYTPADVAKEMPHEQVQSASGK
jgi:CRISPR-associated protein Cmr3